MVSFAKFALLASLQSMRSIILGRNFKALILRSLLLWPRILRSLRKVWSWYFQPNFSDKMKTKGDNGEPSSLGTLRKREECVVVCASRDFRDVGRPSRHSISGYSYAEQSIPLEIVIRRTPSVPHSLGFSHAPSPQGSPRLSAAQFPSGNPHSLSSSLREESPRLPPIHGWMPSFPTRYQLTSTESTNPRLVSSHSRGDSPSIYGVHTGAHQSTESFQDSMTLQSIQTLPRPPFTFPELFVPHISTQTPTANVSNPLSRSTTLVRPMPSNQVSRYAKKGDV